MQETEIKTLIKSIVDSKDALFSEFNSIKDNIDSMFSGCVVTYPVYDNMSVYTENPPKFNEFESVLPDADSDIITVSFNTYDQPPFNYHTAWDSQYPLYRIYVSDSDDSNNVQVMFRDGDKLIGKDWNGGNPIDSTGMAEATDNTYIMIDIWVGASPMSTEQKQAYFKHMQFLHPESPFPSA
jgi:hypothetical protein